MDPVCFTMIRRRGNLRRYLARNEDECHTLRFELATLCDSLSWMQPKQHGWDRGHEKEQHA